MRVERAKTGARGVDTITHFGTTLAAGIKASGYSYVVRYLGALTVAERNIILKADLALIAVGYSRRPGWHPSLDLGDSDGLHAIANARTAGLLEGMTLYCDLEGPSGTSDDCITYVNAWASRVQAAGFEAGLYVGYGIPLTAHQLYWSLKTTAYWDSCSKNPLVDVRGFSMFQHHPPNQKVAGGIVDVNHIEADQKGSTPNWLIGAP